jgi:hypothetical protein
MNIYNAHSASVFEDLCLGRTFRGRFLLGGSGAPGLHFAAVESRGVDFAAATGR